MSKVSETGSEIFLSQELSEWITIHKYVFNRIKLSDKSTQKRTKGRCYSMTSPQSGCWQDGDSSWGGLRGALWDQRAVSFSQSFPIPSVGCCITTLNSSLLTISKSLSMWLCCSTFKKGTIAFLFLDNGVSHRTCFGQYKWCQSQGVSVLSLGLKRSSMFLIP